MPEPEAVRLALLQPSVAAVPTVAFRLATAQAASLAHADLLIVPHINLGSEVERGGGQDHWIAEFPQALRGAVPGLPPLVAVPTALGEEVEPIAVSLLTHLMADAGRVGRVWTRHRVASHAAPRIKSPRWTMPGKTTVGLVGQPWNLSPRVCEALIAEDEHGVSANSLDPATLRDEGWRGDKRLVPSDAEVIGAARLFSRRGGVSRLRYVADRESGIDAWLYQRVREAVAHKDVALVGLQETYGDTDMLDAALITPAAGDGR